MKAWGANRIRYPGSPRRKRWMLDVGPFVHAVNGGCWMWGPFSGSCVGANALSIPPGEYGRKTKTQRN